jgi:hypothetical protein
MQTPSSNFPDANTDPQVAVAPVNVDRRRPRPSRSRAPVEEKNVSLDSIQQHLQQIIARSDNLQDATSQFVALARQMTNAAWCGQFQRFDAGHLACIAEDSGLADQNVGLIRSSLLPHIESAIATGKSQVVNDGDMTVIANPVFQIDSNGAAANKCLCLALNLQGDAAEPFLLIAQVISAAMTQFHQHSVQRQQIWKIDSTAAIAELMSKIVDADGVKKATMVATNELAGFLGASQVAIGFTRCPGGKKVRLESISGNSQFDRAGKQSALLESVLDETLIRECISSLPEIEGDDCSLKLAHRKLLEASPGTRLISAPLVTESGETIGAWLCLVPDSEINHQQVYQFADATSQHLADALQAACRAAEGPGRRLRNQLVEFYHGRAARWTIAGLIAATVLMLIPIPHRISCTGGLHPTSRRFAVVPHDGILLESLVKPGDLAVAGQVVARMDDRELRLKLSSLMAQRETAVKKQDVSRTSRDAAATRIASLEIDQLDTQIDLVKFQIDHLEITSTVNGVVLQGDWEDAQGAPVRKGDVLAEVAPLERLKIQLDIPESDVAHVEVGQAMTLVLDGDPFRTHRATIESIKPTSEVRGNQNVFVAELEIENPDNQLRPGMKGRAKVAAGLRPLGWVLFHHPAERVYSMLR